MSHVCGRASSEKDLSVFNKPFKTADDNDCSVNRSIADCKVKRLRKRKERSQMRGGGEKASQVKSHHHRHCPSWKDVPRFHNCCHGNRHCPSRREAPFLNVVPASQEPSIITDSRLIGHQGLFNHEVKSVDIERLLSEQRKREKSGKRAQKKITATSCLPSASHTRSLASSNDFFGDDDTDEVVLLEKKTDLTKNTHCQAKKKEILESDCQESDVTPGQRPPQQHEPSSGSCGSDLLSQHKSKTADSVTSEKGRVSQPTPTCERLNVKPVEKVKGQTLLTLEHTPKSQGPPVHQTQAPRRSPSSPQLSSSPTAQASGDTDTQHRRNVPDCVSRSVGAVAARLCRDLQFPIREKRQNLLSECREVLLRALQERHGVRLRENLHEVQQCLSFGRVQDQNQKPNLNDEDGPWSTDTFPAAFGAHDNKKSRFCSHKPTDVRITGSRHFNWNIWSKPQQSSEQAAKWVTSPVRRSDSSYDILRPSSPLLCMDFEPTRASSSDHLFAPSDPSFWGETASASLDWENRFNRPNTNESLVFDSFENSSMNHDRPARKTSSGSQYVARLPDPWQPRRFPKEHDAFETEKHAFAPAFSAQIPQSKWSDLHHPRPCFFHSSHYCDMMSYPPSYMVERDTAPPSSCLSPEHWSFPPMRLY